jgi:hypothetical protein
VIGRRKPAVTTEQVRAQLTAEWPNVLTATMPTTFSGVRRENFLAIRLLVDEVTAPAERLLRRQFRHPLLVAMAIALFVLVMACVNLASLMLARVMRRRREIGVQLALGASRWRVARQILAEGMMLSVVAGACGLIVAPPITSAVSAMLLRTRSICRPRWIPHQISAFSRWRLSLGSVQACCSPHFPRGWRSDASHSCWFRTGGVPSVPRVASAAG